MEELKWTKGEKYEQSFKEDKSKYIQHEVVDSSTDYNNMKP